MADQSVEMAGATGLEPVNIKLTANVAMKFYDRLA
jgi:hypothetical protein